jgi:flagellar motor switch protein FliG
MAKVMGRSSTLSVASFFCASLVALMTQLSLYQTAFASQQIQAFQSMAPADPEKLRFDEETIQRIRTKLQSDVTKYCPDGCTILGVDVESRELFDTNSASLGFESATVVPRTFLVSSAVAEVLIDNRLGKSNIERIRDVLLRASRRYGVPLEIEFTNAALPDPPHVIRAEAEAKSEAVSLVKSSIERILSDFCPLECRLQTLEVKTVRIPLEDAQSSLMRRAVVIRESKHALVVSGVTASLTLASEMEDNRRLQIENLLRDHLDNYGQGILNVKLTSMPKAASELQKDSDELRNDPWGLERLGRSLRIFREFANTKEVIRERDSISRESERERQSEKERERNRESLSEKSNSSQSVESSQTKELSDTQKTLSENGLQDFWTKDRVLLFAGVFAVLLLVGALGLRYVLSSKQVQHLISEGRGVHAPQADFRDDVAIPAATEIGQSAFGASPPVTTVPAALPIRPRAVVIPAGGINDEVAQRMNIQSLRDELTQMFISQPKIARDVFSRILREDGIEFSAKCVSVLGEIMVFDLLGDDDVKKEVALLAEYIHVNAPIVGDSEQLSVLRSLKLKLTAGKIRQMTQRAQDTFDFLKSFSGRQIYDLICDESARSQAVVLTQLPTDKRRAVFELFEGSLKSALLRELCIKETLPREYLFNVAMALKRKIEKMGAAGGEMLGGADVIIDLVERSERDSQLEMLENLDRTNPELARQVRSRFVSVETLAYLSDGLLLEIFLALEPQVMVTFLAGTRDKIRQLVLRKAPDEIADDWNESASNIRGLDSESFRLAEMQVLSKIRSFAASGLINLSEINEVMYPRVSPSEADTAIKDMSRRFKISSPVVA